VPHPRYSEGGGRILGAGTGAGRRHATRRTKPLRDFGEAEPTAAFKNRFLTGAALFERVGPRACACDSYRTVAALPRSDRSNRREERSTERTLRDGRESRRLTDRYPRGAARAFSSAVTICGSSGFIFGENFARSFPSRPTRYFWKFHSIGPAMDLSGFSTRYLYRGA